MSISGIQGQVLEVTVVGCTKLKDTEWMSRQDPYVCLEYGSTKFRTRTCTDGDRNPTFQEKVPLTLIEGLRELHVAVWNSNNITLDAFVGSGRVQLHKVLSQGFDDSSWPLQTKTGRHAGEVRLIMHYANANRPVVYPTLSAPSYVTPSAPLVPVYSTPPPVSAASYAPPVTAASYAPPVTAAPYGPPMTAAPYGPPMTAAPYAPPASSYLSASQYSAYPPPPNPAAYPPPPAFPPPPYLPPTSVYPPPPYPPPPGGLPYGPPGHYPPPPYPPWPY